MADKTASKHSDILEGVDVVDRVARAHAHTLMAGTEAVAADYFITAIQGKKSTSLQYVLAVAVLKAGRIILRCLPRGRVGALKGVLSNVFLGLGYYLKAYPDAEQACPNWMDDYTPRAAAQKALMATVEPTFVLMDQALQRIEFQYPSDQLDKELES